MTSQYVVRDDVLFTENFGRRRSTRYRERKMARSNSEKSLIEFFNEDFGSDKGQTIANDKNLPAFLKDMKNIEPKEGVIGEDIEYEKVDFEKQSFTKSPAKSVETVFDTPIDVFDKPVDVFDKPIDVFDKQTDVSDKPIDVFEKQIDNGVDNTEIESRQATISRLSNESCVSEEQRSLVLTDGTEYFRNHGSEVGGDKEQSNTDVNADLLEEINIREGMDVSVEILDVNSQGENKESRNEEISSPSTDELLASNGKRSRVSSIGDVYEDLLVEEGDAVSLSSYVGPEQNNEKVLQTSSNLSLGKLAAENSMFEKTPTGENLDLKSSGNSPVNVEVESSKRAQSVISARSVSSVTVVGEEVNDHKSFTGIVIDDIKADDAKDEGIYECNSSKPDILVTGRTQSESSYLICGQELKPTDEETLDINKSIENIHEQVAEEPEVEENVSSDQTGDNSESETEFEEKHENLDKTAKTTEMSEGENFTVVDNAIQRVIKNFHMDGENSEAMATKSGNANSVVPRQRENKIDIKGAMEAKDTINEKGNKIHKTINTAKQVRKHKSELKVNENKNIRRSGQLLTKRNSSLSGSVQSETDNKIQSTDLSMYSSDFDRLMDKLRNNKAAKPSTPQRIHRSSMRKSLESSRECSPYYESQGGMSSPCISNKGSPQNSRTYPPIHTASPQRKKSYPENARNVKLPVINSRKRTQLTQITPEPKKNGISVANHVDVKRKDVHLVKNKFSQQHGGDNSLKTDERIPRPENGGVPVRLKSEAIYRNGHLEVSVTDEKERLSDNVAVNITVVHKHVTANKNIKSKKPNNKLPKLNLSVNRDVVKQRAMFPPFNTLTNPKAERFRNTFGF